MQPGLGRSRTSSATYAAAGVNRLSFGVQSMQPHVLAELGRTHDPANVERAVRWARAAGFEHLNLDLIYGTPCESVDDWRRTLDGALALEPDHVSAYALTVEPGTPLGRDIAAGGRRAPDDDDQAEKYEIADDTLRAAGFEWYEISNWARPGGECRHNLLYWEQGDYLAIGAPRTATPTAAGGGTCAPRSATSPRSSRARRPKPGEELLDARPAAEEALMLALRTRGGVPVAAGHRRRWPTSSPPTACVDRCRDRLVLTRRGRLLASESPPACSPRSPSVAPGTPDLRREVALGRLDC